MICFSSPTVRSLKGDVSRLVCVAGLLCLCAPKMNLLFFWGGVPNTPLRGTALLCCIKLLTWLMFSIYAAGSCRHDSLTELACLWLLLLAH